MTNSCSLWSVLDSDGYMKTISSTSTTFLSAWVYHLSSDLETLVDYKPGWWFGTFFIFPYIWNFIIPTDFHIFQRGWYTTNQKWKILFKWIIIMENPIKSMVNLCHEPSSIHGASPWNGWFFVTKINTRRVGSPSVIHHGSPEACSPEAWNHG